MAPSVKHESGESEEALWWSTERVFEDDDGPLLDWSILRDPNFLAAIAGLLVAQLLAAWWLLSTQRAAPPAEAEKRRKKNE